MPRVGNKCSFCGAPLRRGSRGKFGECEFCGQDPKFSTLSVIKTKSSIGKKIVEPLKRTKDLIERSNSNFQKFSKESIKRIKDRSNIIIEKNKTFFAEGQRISRHYFNASKGLVERKLLNTQRKKRIVFWYFPIGLVSVSAIYSLALYLPRQREYAYGNYVDAAIKNCGFSNYIKDHTKAIEDYTKAINLFPNKIQAYRLRAECESKAGNFIKAINDYSKAIEIMPNNEYLYVNRASVKEKNGDLKEAIADYSKALEIQPNYWKYYKLRASIKEKNNDLKGAIEDYSFAIVRKPRQWDLYKLRASIKERKGDLQGAIDDYNKLIKGSAEKAKAYNSRGELYYKLNKKDKYCADVENALLLGLNRKEVRMGNTYQNLCIVNSLKNTPGLIAPVDVNIDNEKVKFYREKVSRTYLNCKERLRFSNLLLQLQKTGEDYYNRAKAKQECGMHKAAILDFTEALKYNKRALSYKFRASSRIELKDYQGAIDDITKAINLDTNADYLYIDRAEAKERIKDYKSAIVDLSKAIEIRPIFESYNLRANLKEKAGDRKGAFDDYILGINIKENYKGLYSLGRFYLDEGDYVTAIKKFNSAQSSVYNNKKYWYNKYNRVFGYKQLFTDIGAELYNETYLQIGLAKYLLSDYRDACLKWRIYINTSKDRKNLLPISGINPIQVSNKSYNLYHLYNDHCK